jgi:hypothetical protein
MGARHCSVSALKTSHAQLLSNLDTSHSLQTRTPTHSRRPTCGQIVRLSRLHTRPCHALNQPPCSFTLHARVQVRRKDVRYSKPGFPRGKATLLSPLWLWPGQMGNSLLCANCDDFPFASHPPPPPPPPSVRARAPFCPMHHPAQMLSMKFTNFHWDEETNITYDPQDFRLPALHSLACPLLNTHQPQPTLSTSDPICSGFYPPWMCGQP